MTISSDQISVIVQGAVGQEIVECITSVRKVLPRAEIILSTWEGSSIPGGLPINTCLFSADPGARPSIQPGSAPNNTNRQLVSTLAGLRRATRAYALKLRTDFHVLHDGFADAFSPSDVRDGKFTLFKHKIVIPHYATRFPTKDTASSPFHPSDLSLFGLTEDLIKFFDVPLVSNDDWDWAVRHKGIHRPITNTPIYLPRFAPEQHFFVNSLRLNGHAIEIEYHHDTRGDIATQSRRYIANNFVVLDMKRYGVSTKKASLSYAMTKDINDCYSHKIYRTEYRKWCDPHAPLTWPELLEARLIRRKHFHEKLVKHKFAMQQHAQMILEKTPEGSFTHSHKMVADAISTAYYFARAIL